MTLHLHRPFAGSPAVTQPFANVYAVEPLGWLYPDGSIAYTPGPGAVENHYHNGLDLGLPYGTQLSAPADGVVTYAARDNMGLGGTDSGFGLRLSINHGEVQTLYGHLDVIQVRVGQAVKQGQPIALSGGAPQYPGDWRSGLSSGSHLHFSVIRNSDGHYVSPAPYFTDAPPPVPKPTDAVTYVAFTVTTPGPDRGVTRVFDGPSDQLVQTDTIAPNTKVVCDAYLKGQPRLDPTTGRWDPIWAHRGSGGWIPSAHFIGYPPGVKAP